MGTSRARRTRRNCPGDIVDNRLFLQTSFDGSQRSGAALTQVRIVCDNTRGYAWNGNKNKVTRSHRSKLNGSGLNDDLGVSQSAFAADVEACQRLADSMVSDGQARDILRALFGQKPALQARETETKTRPDVLPLMQGGALDLAYLLNSPAHQDSVKPELTIQDDTIKTIAILRRCRSVPCQGQGPRLTQR